MKGALVLLKALLCLCLAVMPAPAAACEVVMQRDASEALAGFNSRWSSEAYPPIAVAAEAFEEAEKAFHFAYPASYRHAILSIGLPRPTADLWDAIGEDSDLPHLHDFLTPAEAVEASETWRSLGYPDHLVPFATDSLGNLLSFRTTGGCEAVSCGTMISTR